jgi:hypothetical protein
MDIDELIRLAEAAPTIDHKKLVGASKAPEVKKEVSHDDFFKEVMEAVKYAANGAYGEENVEVRRRSPLSFILIVKFPSVLVGSYNHESDEVPSSTLEIKDVYWRVAYEIEKAGSSICVAGRWANQ